MSLSNEFDEKIHFIQYIVQKLILKKIRRNLENFSQTDYKDLNESGLKGLILSALRNVEDIKNMESEKQIQEKTNLSRFIDIYCEYEDVPILFELKYYSMERSARLDSAYKKSFEVYKTTIPDFLRKRLSYNLLKDENNLLEKKSIDDIASLKIPVFVANEMNKGFTIQERDFQQQWAVAKDQLLNYMQIVRNDFISITSDSNNNNNLTSSSLLKPNYIVGYTVIGNGNLLVFGRNIMNIKTNKIINEKEKIVLFQ